jgi:hypothetical protein
VNERLITPHEAGERVADMVAKQWAAGVCAEVGGTELFHAPVRLRPGVEWTPAVARLGFDVWHDWIESWHEVADARLPGVEIGAARVPVQGVSDQVAVELTVTGLDAAVAFLGHVGVAAPRVDLGRARAVARELYEVGAVLTPGILKRTVELPDADVRALISAVKWLADHPDVSAWTARQLRVPAMHSKWLENASHDRLLRDVTGRDLRSELRPRLSVAHLTYVHPDYLAKGERRHDAWTTGDVHDLPYSPRTVLVVENRQNRLWFPPVDDTIVVEGGGKAAASLLADVPWIRSAENIVYWGDIDSAGFAILDHFRRALAEPGRDGSPGRHLASILMDGTTAQAYASSGVSTDKEGRPIPPSSAHLATLTVDELAAYYSVATAGDAEFRRIEQEHMSFEHARSALLALTGA